MMIVTQSVQSRTELISANCSRWLAVDKYELNPINTLPWMTASLPRV
jgi:hypothetical protein